MPFNLDLKELEIYSHTATLTQEANAEEEAARQAAVCSAATATPALRPAKDPQALHTVCQRPAAQV